MGDDDMQKNGEATERKREIEEDDDGDDSSDGETQSECIVRHLAAPCGLPCLQLEKIGEATKAQF